jgi:hypothetical protein
MTKTKQDDFVPVLPVFCSKDNALQTGESRTNKFKRELKSMIVGKIENIKCPG